MLRHTAFSCPSGEERTANGRPYNSMRECRNDSLKCSNGREKVQYGGDFAVFYW